MDFSEINLPEGVLECVEGLARYPEIKSVYLFGSRATGKSHDRSDCDLAISMPEKNSRLWLDLEEEIRRSTVIPLDVIRLEDAPTLMQAQVQREGIQIFNEDKSWMKLFSFAKVLEQLEKVLSETNDKDNYIRDSSIQRFEICIELALKTFKIFLEKQQLVISSPRQAISSAFQMGWIQEEGLWADMVNDRNELSHAYKAVSARRIYTALPQYLKQLKFSYNKLRQELG